MILGRVRSHALEGCQLSKIRMGDLVRASASFGPQ
jgi:hypothetical protein